MTVRVTVSGPGEPGDEADDLYCQELPEEDRLLILDALRNRAASLPAGAEETASSYMDIYRRLGGTF